MWFGVAPAPAPSPRTNTKAWHPPHCSCARHGGGADHDSPRSLARRSIVDGGSMSQGPSSGRRERWLPTARSPQKLTFHSPGRSPRASDTTASSSRQRMNEEPTLCMDEPVVGNRLRAPAPGGDSPFRRLSRRLSKNQPFLDPTLAPATKDDELQPAAIPTGIWINPENNHEPTEWSKVPSIHSHLKARSKLGSAGLRPDRTTSSVMDDNDEHRASVTSRVERNPSSSTPSRSRRATRDQICHNEHGFRFQPTRLHSPVCRLLAPADAVAHLSAPVAERSQPTNLVGHTSSVGVVLVDDDSFIVSCSIDGSVKVWSQHTFDCLYTLYGHNDAVSSVDLSSQWLVSGSHDHTLRVYESGHGFRFIHALEGHTGHVTRVKLVTHMHDQDLVLSCSDDATLRLWDVVHGSCLVLYKMHLSRITCVLVIPTPTSVICSGSADASVCVWDLLIPRPSTSPQQPCEPKICSSASKVFRTHKSTVQSLLRGDSVPELSGCCIDSLVFSCSNDGTIQWFDVRSHQHLGCIDSVDSPLYSIVYHPHLQSLVCSTGDGRLLVYTGLMVGSGRGVKKQELKVASKWISSLQPLKGQFLACASDDELYIVNLERPRIERLIGTAHGFLNCVRWLKHDKLVTSGEDNVIKVWSIL